MPVGFEQGMPSPGCAEIDSMDHNVPYGCPINGSFVEPMCGEMVSALGADESNQTGKWTIVFDMASM